MINLTKLLNLAGAKKLYDDLRDRIEGKYTKPDGGIPSSDIAPGVIPDPTELIDDTAGAGDTDKTWSVDKSASAVSALNNRITAKGLPDVSSSDNGKMLQVVNGTWAAATISAASGVSF